MKIRSSSGYLRISIVCFPVCFPRGIKSERYRIYTVSPCMNEQYTSFILWDIYIHACINHTIFESENL